jgi:RNA polymerase sigma factor (sigma-70 family)
MTVMIEDTELLRRYAEEKSEDAFAELVRRHVNFVYACAVRRVGGNAHLAEDVTQQVFAALARDAGKVARRDVLSGWLYATARNVAVQVVRSERRRAVREQEAHTMNELSATAAQDAEWARLRPVIDEAMDDLREEDREAVLLRFFEGKSFGEIGAKLRLSENTARMRVDRALATLHAGLARRGVSSTAAALGVALAGQAAVAAPAGLAASVTAAVLAGGNVASAVGAGGVGAIFLGMTKLQVVIAGALAVAGAAGFVAQGRTNEALRQEIGVMREQQQAVVALKAENRQLAGVAAEVEVLRRDDGEFKQLAQRVAELRQSNEDMARLAQARVQARRAESAWRAEQDRLVQREVDRMNREGNQLVGMYKSLSARARDELLSMETRAQAEEAAKKKLTEIKEKQAEVEAYIRAKQLELGGFVESKAVFRAGLSSAGGASVPGVVGPADQGASVGPTNREGSVKSAPQD